MSSLPTLTIIENSKVSPPYGIVGDRFLPLIFFDIFWLKQPAVHNLFFYEVSITRTEFTKTIVPNLKQSLSTTLQYFFPFAGKLIIFPTNIPSRKPEIRYVEGDSVAVTFAECNLDFIDLVGNHPRECDKFYNLIPVLGHIDKVNNYLTIPVFSVQVSLFPNNGISIGVTNHHSLGDATTTFSFFKAWAMIAQFGTGESFLANGTLPIYERIIVDPKRDESYLKNVKVETFNKDYQLPRLSGPTNKVRATFILTRDVINQLKKTVTTHFPRLSYVSSFTVACGYIWSCIAKSRSNEVVVFGFPIDCRTRLHPPIPAAYFGNCLSGCMSVAKASNLVGKEGFLTAAKLIGEDLHKILTDTVGVVKDLGLLEDILVKLKPTMITGVTNTPKLKFYDLDFGFGKPNKHEAVSIDYSGSISLCARKESNKDMEIGVCLSAIEMEVFVRTFNDGLEKYF